MEGSGAGRGWSGIDMKLRTGRGTGTAKLGGMRTPGRRGIQAGGCSYLTGPSSPTKHSRLCKFDRSFGVHAVIMGLVKWSPIIRRFIQINMDGMLPVPTSNIRMMCKIELQTSDHIFSCALAIL